MSIIGELSRFVRQRHSMHFTTLFMFYSYESGRIKIDWFQWHYIYDVCETAWRWVVMTPAIFVGENLSKRNDVAFNQAYSCSWGRAHHLGQDATEQPGLHSLGSGTRYLWTDGKADMQGSLHSHVLSLESILAALWVLTQFKTLAGILLYIADYRATLIRVTQLCWRSELLIGCVNCCARMSLFISCITAPYNGTHVHREP